MKFGVAVAIVNENNEILIGKRLKKSGFGKYAPPGGKVEDDETAKAAAIRETFEETGLKLNHLEHMGQTSFNNEELTTEWYFCHTFKGGPLNFQGEPVNTEPEKCAGWEWHSVYDMPDNLWMGFGQIKDEIVRRVTAQQIRRLRLQVNCGIMEAEIALRNSNWDVNEAEKYIRDTPRRMSTRNFTDLRF